ncbi:AAA family ATPase [Mesorhizobium sp. B2-3-12]|uniref:AAA family ATPase n=1 Tax=Mesorhizobium sp. B2-3-12 TaxID=2589952 RepID=UPI0011280CFC|nr:AAA family ATPase [Mesorhizobium sp. B2-3-12]TPL87117.1 hypothetical protein FJ948_21715 [Mesorhizobium sp. B2-3-12]
MTSGNIAPHAHADKFQQFLASIKPSDRPPFGPIEAAEIAPAAAHRSPFSAEIDRLTAGGYLPLLRPCLPPGVRFTTWDKATKTVVEKTSDGKVPGELVGDKWRAMADWRNRTPTAADVATWRNWPDAGICLTTGGVGALDIDIKIDRSETGAEAERARSLVDAIKRLTADALDRPVDQLPMRWRENSTSCMVLMRLATTLGKRRLHLVDVASGRQHAVEFLATGQQIVVSGVHVSGSRVRSSLPDIPFDALPILESGRLDALVPAIAEKAASMGFRLASSKAGSGKELKPPYSPAVAVLRAVMARRAEWAPQIVPCRPSSDHEWRVTSAELDRDLEEDLAIFADGIEDYGAEWTHTPASLVVEFGSIDADGDITYGGSPLYGSRGGRPFAPVGELDASIRRPSEAEALTWLCRRLAGNPLPAFERGATWATSLPAIGRSVGLVWEALEAARFFDHVEGDRPESWQADRLVKNADFLVAIRAVEPERFSRIEDAHQSGAVDLCKLADERQAAVATSPIRLEAPTPGSISWIDPASWTGKPIRAREWEVEGWIPRHETTLLYGDGGVGKTLLIHQYATCAATGKSFLGQETRPARVMAFFCEDSEDELHRRQADINGMLHVDYSDLANLRISSRKHDDNALGVWDKAMGTTKLTPAWHRLRDDAVAWGADVVIVDTLSDVYVGDEIARAQVNSFVKTCLGRLASEIGGSVIALGHPSVSGKTSGTGTSGSTQWSNAVRSRLYLRYPDKTERGKIRELETMKLNYGPKGSVLKIRWDRGAFDVVAGMSTADRPAGFPASAVPDLADAVEAAVAAAINECAGVALATGRTSANYAPKVLKRRSPDVLQAFSVSEVEAAIGRMEQNGTIRHEEIGRDGSRRAVKGYVLVPDKMSASSPKTDAAFD